MKGEKMGLIKIFTKAKCPKCPAVKEIGRELKKEGVPVLNYDLDTIEGLAEASFYSILSTPSLVIEDEEEREVVSPLEDRPFFVDVVEGVEVDHCRWFPLLGRGEG